MVLDPPAPARPSRRVVLRALGAATAGALVDPAGLLAAAAPPPALASLPLLTKAIPATGERLPVVGMGSWITFDEPALDLFIAPRVEVLRGFFAMGGALVDSSPMYGRAEEMIGNCLRPLGRQPGFFPATKVWTPFQALGRRQIADSQRLWGVEKFSLLQIHNMLAWESHLETLRGMKAQGRVRYVGITTSHGRRHEAMAEVIAKEPFDFMQVTYNILDREAEARLLPLAAERRVAVIANRPFRRGALIETFGRRPLPPWAAEIDCRTWPQFLLKFVVSHPAITCAIPATSRADHMAENMGAARGRLPDAAMRQRMVRYVEGL
ncbi:MAG TPA: aldo/keto reductase [Thermoanaerobaculia bacterium]|jgi:diketogulonate reductase-like aldo/keto reductase|nr:aldo/keto reductase [Thermoanaerobaculia bacterium]